MKKTFSKIIALVLALCCLFGISAQAYTIPADIDTLRDSFIPGEGPVEDGYSVDYRYFSPVKKNDSTKYPLVVWLHGMGDGNKEGNQVTKSHVALWASEDYQKRFGKGAFIFCARSREELGICWDNSMVEPLRAAIEDFIAKNKANIDTTKIYVGGYSMGGKMTFKMAIAYPEMFAAAFPICPAWAPSTALLEKIKDMPVWITTCQKDPIVNYGICVEPTWNKLCSVSDVAAKCRFSTLSTACYGDGTKAPSNHHAWYAVNNDMFSDDKGVYPKMTTVNGKGEDVKLTYPNGMISWLTSHKSDYDGKPLADGMGNLEGAVNTDIPISFEFDGIFDIIMEIVNMIVGLIKSFIK